MQGSARREGLVARRRGESVPGADRRDWAGERERREGEGGRTDGTEGS